MPQLKATRIVKSEGTRKKTRLTEIDYFQEFVPTILEKMPLSFAELYPDGMPIGYYNRIPMQYLGCAYSNQSGPFSEFIAINEQAHKSLSTMHLVETVIHEVCHIVANIYAKRYNDSSYRSHNFGFTELLLSTVKNFDIPSLTSIMLKDIARYENKNQENYKEMLKEDMKADLLKKLAEYSKKAEVK